jgi:hypothetical protein
MKQEPSRFVAGIEHPVQLMRRHAFLARGHQVRGHDPFRQRDMRALHDSADRHAKRLAAILALIDARTRAFAGQLGNAISSHSTARTEGTGRPKHLFKMLARLIIIVKNGIAKVDAAARHIGLPFNSQAIL